MSLRSPKQCSHLIKGEASDFAKAAIKRLDDEASKYSNSRFVPETEQQAWSWSGWLFLDAWMPSCLMRL